MRKALALCGAVVLSLLAGGIIYTSDSLRKERDNRQRAELQSDSLRKERYDRQRAEFRVDLYNPTLDRLIQKHGSEQGMKTWWNTNVTTKVSILDSLPLKNSFVQEIRSGVASLIDAKIIKKEGDTDILRVLALTCAHVVEKYISNQYGPNHKLGVAISESMEPNPLFNIVLSQDYREFRLIKLNKQYDRAWGIIDIEVPDSSLIELSRRKLAGKLPQKDKEVIILGKFGDEKIAVYQGQAKRLRRSDEGVQRFNNLIWMKTYKGIFKHGDSGSLIVGKDKNIYGILIAVEDEPYAFNGYGVPLQEIPEIPDQLEDKLEVVEYVEKQEGYLLSTIVGGGAFIVYLIAARMIRNRRRQDPERLNRGDSPNPS